MTVSKLLVTSLSAILLAACAAAPVSQQNVTIADSAVTVEYVHPEKFTDVGDSEFTNEKTRDAYLEALGKHLAHRVTPRLASGQTLAVKVSDVDMAGGFEPSRRGYDEVRIIRDVYPPRIDLHFTLTDGSGKVVLDGDRQLRNPTFRTSTITYPGDTLRYEKALIDDWLRREFPYPPA
jgi:hypothetical protein